jgi:pimeloyl-ACP methyl ester carboxylesterase
MVASQEGMFDTFKRGVGALAQRGHGLAEHGGLFTRDEFVADAAAVIDRLGSAPVVELGHSLGGITAYQLAAQGENRTFASKEPPDFLITPTALAKS